MLLLQAARRARSLALASAGNNNAARRAMMAITTSSSIRVNADRQKFRSDGVGQTRPGKFGSEIVVPPRRDSRAGTARMRARKTVPARESDDPLFMKQRH